ncbi:high affinity immunoglobulin gamma Fc receptor I-like [Paralichthys olivaceus]|uniref:high affinity immunoglobulin gamma Fc receptor I-like n=1 Tax=Paralichthys olivaceus TaxID=8255 RepID=UPI003751BC39
MLNRVNIIFLSSLLGVVLHVAEFKGSLEASVSVKPPGPNIYLGESVLLQCTVESLSAFVKSYRWYRSKPHNPNPRHLVSGDIYFITAVTREDTDRYWCQAECRENKTMFVVKARTVSLRVSELPPPFLSLTPNTRQVFRGERFTLRCPSSQTNSSGWKLLHFSPDLKAGTTNLTDHYSSPGGRFTADKSEAFVFTAASVNGGLYWCEGPGGRSNAVNITVSYGDIILKTQAFPVFTGDDVTLSCQYQSGKHKQTSFFKNGAVINSNGSSGSDRVIKMTLKNVTQEDEGFYRCASHDRRMQSPESWLSVSPDRGIFPSEETPASTSGSWKWIIVSCAVLLLIVIPLTVWLVCHYRYQKFRTWGCWPVSKQEVPAEGLPATKQDVTEVQWDLSWMEMSNLLDKH